MARTIAAATTNNSRNRGILLLAAIFGLLSAALMFAFLNGSGSDNGDTIQDIVTAETASTTVVVLVRDVAVGEEITADMLTTRPIPLSAVLETSITDIEEVVGKVATTPLFIGEQIIPQKVTTFDGENTLAYKVPAGMRSLSLEIPHEAWNAAGLVQPGDRVDILGITTFLTVDPLTGEEKLDLRGGLIAQDAIVLAVSQELVRIVPNLDAREGAADPLDPEAAGASLSAEDDATLNAQPLGDTASFEEAISVTLALLPEEAAKVAIIDALKDDQGQYRILVRQTGDREILTGKTSWSFEDLFEPIGQ